MEGLLLLAVEAGPEGRLRMGSLRSVALTEQRKPAKGGVEAQSSAWCSSQSRNARWRSVSPPPPNAGRRRGTGRGVAFGLDSPALSHGHGTRSDGSSTANSSALRAGASSPPGWLRGGQPVAAGAAFGKTKDAHRRQF